MCWLCDEYGDKNYGNGFWYLNPRNYSRNMYKLREPGQAPTGAGVYLEGGKRGGPGLQDLLLAQEEGRVEEALELLAQIYDSARAVGGIGLMIEARSLEARIYQAQDELDRALEALEDALVLGEPEGYVRTFADRGAPMARLLVEAAARGIMPDYTEKLLATFGADAEDDTAPLAQPLIEPLSPRELEVLQLVAQGLSNREIAERLFLALTTVKGHNSRIFGKLQVRRRTEAVARARELGLL